MKLDMIGLTVKDIGKSLAFYGEMGLATPQEWEGPYVEITLEGGIRMSWNDVEMVKTLPYGWEPPVGHRMGLAFLCDSVADVDARHARLVAAGYKSVADPFDAFWGQRYALVEDPDGNVVDLFHPLT